MKIGGKKIDFFDQNWNLGVFYFDIALLLLSYRCLYSDYHSHVISFALTHFQFSCVTLMVYMVCLEGFSPPFLLFFLVSTLFCFMAYAHTRTLTYRYWWLIVWENWTVEYGHMCQGWCCVYWLTITCFTP